MRLPQKSTFLFLGPCALNRYFHELSYVDQRFKTFLFLWFCPFLVFSGVVSWLRCVWGFLIVCVFVVGLCPFWFSRFWTFVCVCWLLFCLCCVMLSCCLWLSFVGVDRFPFDGVHLYFSCPVCWLTLCDRICHFTHRPHAWLVTFHIDSARLAEWPL